ncbi:MAG: Hsp20/alpha crystallin family protein [Clostridia bacterium]|nr:Hsp20/alpha crystallin family protein [Clostridia bacterium]
MYTILPSRRNTLYRPGSDFIRSFFDVTDMLRPVSLHVDVKEEEGFYKLEADLPGVPKDLINLSVKEDCLTISADMNREKKEQKEGYLYSERHSGHVERSFNMEGIDTANITAAYENGVLTVTLPKQTADEKPQAKKIDIG